MPRPRPLRAEDALARAVLDRYLEVQRGESLTIETWSHALPWARSFVVEARRRGVVPTLVLEDEPAFFRSLEAGGAPIVSGPRRAPVPRSRAYVYLGGPEAFPRLLGLPPVDLERIVTHHDASWWTHARREGTRGVRLVIAGATPTAAARYGVDLDAWRSELLRASRVDPRRLEAAGERLARGLAGARRLRVRHPNGTDLTVRRTAASPIVESGRPKPASGSVWGSIPSGLLVIPLASGRADGSWESNRAVYDRFARPPLAVGGRFEFTSGRLTEFAFERGGEALALAYARAGRGREQPTALTVGLNPEVARAPEVGELAVGTVGLLLGDSPYRRRGSPAGFSFLSSLAGADVEVDGVPWLVRGVPRHRARG